MKDKQIIKKRIMHPTFKNAQALFQSYTTLQTNDTIETNLINTIDSELLSRYSKKSSREIFNEIILKYYPNELSVKSSFINQVLFKTNDHVTIFELPIGNSRIDLCKINGSSTAYEIKTDLDNLSRLNKQLNDYLEIFENVFVICSHNRLADIEKQILPDCGIYIYTISQNGKYVFQIYRNAISSTRLNAKKQLNILRKKELINNFGIKTITNRKEITNLIIEENSNIKINTLYKHIIKTRYQNNWDFLKSNKSQILEIDYQWFFKNTINPDLVYS